MQLNPAEISELIKSRIEGLSASADIRNQGTVVSVTDGICRVHGLADVMQGLALVIRERMRLGRRFRVLIAQTQVSKRILLAMPCVMFGVLHLISPEYMEALYVTSAGQFLLLGAMAITILTPILGLLLRKIAVARFCSTLSTLTSSGVRLIFMG